MAAIPIEASRAAGRACVVRSRRGPPGLYLRTGIAVHAGQGDPESCHRLINVASGVLAGHPGKAGPRRDPSLLDLDPDPCENFWADQARMAQYEALVYEIRDDHDQFGTGIRQCTLEQSCFEHTKQQVDFSADEAVAVMTD